MKKIILTMALLLIAVPAFAQKIPSGSKIYVANMDANLNNYISAEILKQKLPIVVVTEESTADYTLSGHAQFSGHNERGNGALLNPIRTHEQYSGAVTLASNGAHTVVWGSDTDDAKVKQIAERIVKKMKRDLFK